MNDPTLIGPCADYEHDLVDLHDGELAPDRASAVRLHVEYCARCRAWAHAYAGMDARLAAELPRPVLSAGFEARLQQSIAALAPPASRRDLRGTLATEYDALLASLRQGARRQALLGATGAAAVAGCALVVGRALLAGDVGLLADGLEGPQHWMLVGSLGVAVAVAGLGWSALRGGLPLPWLAR